MQMQLWTIWLETVTTCFLIIAQEATSGELRILVQEALGGHKDSPMKTGELLAKDQECKHQQFHMDLTIFIVLDPLTPGPTVLSSTMAG